MTHRRQTIIQQRVIADVMSHLSELPERGKDSVIPISLSDVFRTKEYVAEIKGALKKGYTFNDLAEIFTERCGVVISARQMKYHYTRGQNLRVKGKSGAKSKRAVVHNDSVSPANPNSMSAGGERKDDIKAAAGSPVEPSSKRTGFPSEIGEATDSNSDAFPTGKRL